LQADERFRVETPEGAFEFSKAEFYETFPKLVLTRSYREAGIYHFPQVPQAAMRFRM
jgi:hypothetical protein